MEEPEVRAEQSGEHVTVTDDDARHALELSGYGDSSEGPLRLSLVESLYLLYCGRLRLKKKTSFERFLKDALDYDGSILTKFLIYRDLRTRGYTVKDGFGFGLDFRVYDRGDFGSKGAKYLVFGINEGTQEKMGRLQKKVKEITGMGKEPIIALVDRHGQVIYYRISKMSFADNA